MVAGRTTRTADSPCVFCSIIRGQTSARIVLDDEYCIAFLDTKPLFRGHVLVVPRTHVPTLVELPSSLVGPLFQRVKDIAQAVTDSQSAEGTFVAINNKVSQSVPHLHVHVVPRTRGDGLKGFFWPRAKYESNEQQDAIAAAIRQMLPKGPR